MNRITITSPYQSLKTVCCSKPEGKSEEFKPQVPEYQHSHAEGFKYDNKESEVIAMGGDPFFITDDNMDEGEDEIDEQPSFSFLSKMNGEETDDDDGGWDGEVDESAYFD